MHYAHAIEIKPYLRKPVILVQTHKQLLQTPKKSKPAWPLALTKRIVQVPDILQQY